MDTFDNIYALKQALAGNRVAHKDWPEHTYIERTPADGRFADLKLFVNGYPVTDYGDSPEKEEIPEGWVTRQLDFSAALLRLKRGCTIYRQSRNIKIHLDEKGRVICTGFPEFTPYAMLDEDILATDWLVDSETPTILIPPSEMQSILD